MDPYAFDLQLAVAASCPGCDRPASAGTGVALSVERLRGYLPGPVTPVERFEARRHLDRQADGC